MKLTSVDTFVVLCLSRDSSREALPKTSQRTIQMSNGGFYNER